MKKERRYKAVFLSIKNEIQSVSSVCLSSSCMTYTLSFILRKLSLEKTPLVIEILSNLDTG